MKIECVKHILEENRLLLYFPDKEIGEIKNISCDSKKCGEDTLFFVKGVNFKKEYFYEAVRNGAVAYVGENDLGDEIPFIKVSSIRAAMPLIAREFYGRPDTRYKLCGITGTKGKTTVTYMLKNIFEEFFGKNNVGMISTNEAVCGEKRYEKSGTTPEALELYYILNGFAEQDICAACMEVSSQGLWYNRTDGISFFSGIFLNLASDHISPSEHKSFEEYKEAKKRLLKQSRYGIVNLDDKYSSEIISSASCERIFTFSTERTADFEARDIVLTKKGVSFRIKGKYINNELFEIRIPGGFNVSNALAAAACAFICGCDIESIRAGLFKTQIDGRMDIYEKNGVTVVVDYAHNGMSIEAVLSFLKNFYPEAKITCLFGCPGNKALDRRAEIPHSVAKYADFAVITSDDPENEEPEDIMDEVETEFKKTSIPYIKIEDRAQAVRFAITNAEKGDVVLLAGKGHETTQKVRGRLIDYKGDLLCAKEILGGNKD